MFRSSGFRVWGVGAWDLGLLGVMVLVSEECSWGSGFRAAGRQVSLLWPFATSPFLKPMPRTFLARGHETFFRAEGASFNTVHSLNSLREVA